MRKVLLTDYEVTVDAVDGMKTIPYKVRDSLVELMFNPDLKLSAREALERDDFARLILDVSTDDILLEEADYLKLKQACETLKGVTRNDVPLMRRILEAPEVDVEAKA